MFSLKEGTTSRETITYVETLPDYFMTTKWQDTLGNSKLTTLCDNIIGGPDYVHMLKIMCMDVVLVNNLKLTDPRPDPLTSLLKGLNRHDRLQIAPWTLSRTCRQSMGLILFWSW